MSEAKKTFGRFFGLCLMVTCWFSLKVLACQVRLQILVGWVGTEMAVGHSIWYLGKRLRYHLNSANLGAYHHKSVIVKDLHKSLQCTNGGRLCRHLSFCSYGRQAGRFHGSLISYSCCTYLEPSVHCICSVVFSIVSSPPLN